MAPTAHHRQPPKQALPMEVSREWCKMMAGTASAGLGIVQILFGFGLGGFFSLFLAGGLWSGVALRKARHQTHALGFPYPATGLCISRGVLFGCALILGVRILCF